jgi:hypothetical protein
MPDLVFRAPPVLRCIGFAARGNGSFRSTDRPECRKLVLITVNMGNGHVAA